MSKFIHCTYREIYDSEASLGEIALYFRLAIAAGAENSCRVSVAAIAEWMGCTIQWVRRSVRNLERYGFITVERSNGGCGRVNTYHINTVSKTEKSQTGKSETLNAKTGVSLSQNPVENVSKTGTVCFPVNKTDKRMKEKEDPVGNKTLPAQGGESSFKSYPVFPEEILKVFPDADRNVAVNYIFHRNSTNWQKKNGIRIYPRDIALDFLQWIQRERRTPLPAPPLQDDDGIISWDEAFRMNT